MSKPPSIIYECSHCGAQTSKWAGRCFECGQWGTMNAAQEKKETRGGSPLFAVDATPFSAIKAGDVDRYSTHIQELDQVLGGGIVPGSLILIGGEPGIGKSTLLLHISANLLRNYSKQSILYASGEESAQQIKLRLDRLTNEKLSGEELSHLFFIGETNVEKICATIILQKPLLSIVDSIQTIHSSDVPSEAGSVAQVRACTLKLLEVAKEHNLSIVLVGHVTKEGMVAGPKTLEHMVDTVLYLEGDQQHYFRLLKTVKNRFGSTNEVGVFEMTERGLEEVSNPSRVFLGEENKQEVPGTVTTSVIEGSRAFLIQVQALTSKTFFGYPQRRAAGFDTNRLQLLIAVLTKRVGLNLGDQDIHVNVVGGFKITEPGIDLAVCTAIMSAYKNKALSAHTVVFGEVGLNGEVRGVQQMEKRIKEAQKLGYSHIICPLGKDIKASKEVITVARIQDVEL